MSEEEEQSEEDFSEENNGKFSKIADGLADGYEAFNSITTKATADAIRGSGKVLDKTISGSSRGFKDGKNPVDKLGKATIGGTKTFAKETGKAIKNLIDGFGENVEDITKSVKTTTKAVIPSKDEIEKEEQEKLESKNHHHR